jgi:hypothetical protein
MTYHRRVIAEIECERCGHVVELVGRSAASGPL